MGDRPCLIARSEIYNQDFHIYHLYLRVRKGSLHCRLPDGFDHQHCVQLSALCSVVSTVFSCRHCVQLSALCSVVSTVFSCQHCVQLSTVFSCQHRVQLSALCSVV